MAIRFTKENIINDGYYLHYAENGRKTPYADWKFIARFKRGQGGIGTFATHLRKNWTVEDYFAAVEDGKTPLEIVKSTGYLLPHIKKWLKRDGYPTTTEGYAAWRKEMDARWGRN